MNMNAAWFSQFLDYYNLPWLLLAIISWLIIGFSCSREFFFKVWPIGIWTAFVGYICEQFFIHHKYWIEKYIILYVGELDLFVVIGPFFSIGILLIRFLPLSRLGKYFAPLFWSLFATAIEQIGIYFGFLEYAPGKWQALHSVFAYYISLLSALGFYYNMSNGQSK